MNGPEATAEKRQRVDRGLERWIRILDDLVRIPGTRLSLGLDVVLGLLPVVGDFAGLLCGAPIHVEAVRRRLPFRVVLLMVANLLVDAVFGSVPLLGNIFDMLWKAHRKNLLLLRSPESIPEVLREARWTLAALAAIVLLLAAGLAFLLVYFAWLAWRLQTLTL